MTVFDISRENQKYALEVAAEIPVKIKYEVCDILEIDEKYAGYFDMVFMEGGAYQQAIGVLYAIAYTLKMSYKDFEWAVQTAAKKKKLDCSGAEFLTVDEGLCVQMMHLGAFDDEPKSVALMDAFLQENGYVNDFGDTRLHHEIYMSDARKVPPEKWKTVIRHPIKKAE